MQELLNWIDKDLGDINKTELYQIYFDSIQVKEDEGVFYVSNYEQGIELVLSEFKIIVSIHLFGKGQVDQKQFKGPLPLEVDFSFPRAKIKSLLGEPKKTGGGHQNILLGYINIWDKYFFYDYSLRFEYSRDENEVKLVTIASLLLEKDFNLGLQ